MTTSATPRCKYTIHPGTAAAAVATTRESESEMRGHRERGRAARVSPRETSHNTRGAVFHGDGYVSAVDSFRD